MSLPPARQRLAITLAALAPVVFVLLQSGHALLDHGPLITNPCWVMGNGWVVRPPGETGCPLQTLDRVRAVENAEGQRTPVQEPLALNHALAAAMPGAKVIAQRGGRDLVFPYPAAVMPSEAAFARWYAAGIVALLLMMIPLSVLWRSTSPAALPLTLIEACVAVVAVALIAGRSSSLAALASVVALAFIPAGLAHLGLSFPVRRRVLEDVPAVATIPYMVAGFVGLVGVAGLTVSPLLFTTYFWLVVASALSAWTVMLLACLFSVRESASSVERARARLVAYGAFGLPIVPALLMLQEGTTAPEAASTYLWACFLVLALPIGLAISRYNLFDLGWNARKWISQVIYFGIAALLAALAVYAVLGSVAPANPLRQLGILFAIAITCLVGIEWLRRPLLGFLEALFTPQFEKMGRARDRYAREIAQLQDADAVAVRLAEVVEEGLEPSCGAVFLYQGEEWRVAHLFGSEPPSRAALVPEILASPGEKSACHLALEVEAGNQAARNLDRAGFELAALLDDGGTPYGVLLLGHPRRSTPYTGVEVDFASAVCQRAGTALHNARLAAQLIASERHTATSRIAVSLIHDIGKDLGWMRQLVRRAQRQSDGTTEIGEDLAEIGELSESVIERLREFMRETNRSGEETPGVRSLEEVLEASLASVIQRHGASRLHRNVDPDLRRLRCHENVGRAVAHLVENGLQASEPAGSVHIAARLTSESLIELVVTDQGPGIPRELREAAFEPGFTTRRHEGGLGVGLSISRDMIEALGGKIELAPAPTGGTRATVTVPTLSIPPIPTKEIDDADQ